MQKWYEFGFRRRYFQVNTRRCLFLLAKILFANTEKPSTSLPSTSLTTTSQLRHSVLKINPQPKDIPELKLALVKIWDELPQDAICKSTTNFRKRLRPCVIADGGHFDQLL